MIRRLAFALTMGLAACGTPQERCINSVTRDLHIVDQLIAKTEANLARGYAMEDIVVPRARWVLCARSEPDADSAVSANSLMCFETIPEIVSRPKAIDLEEEARKLASLKKKRTELVRHAEPLIAQCRVQYPE